ncbi:hypothetical protein ACEQ8H_008845 [Pleosporales sp. CAS-2024a]
MPMPATFHITLRHAHACESFDSRQFDLALGASFPIGRASRNTTKQDLMPAADNAYIDSPVISRHHALLSARTQGGRPHIFVTDLGSMHGTMVNGEMLAKHTPRQLSSGDKLQFGIDVSRDQDFFVARQYDFEAHLNHAPAPFSTGFSVPDSDSEEVDDGTSPPRGTHGNPLIVLSDSDSDPSILQDDDHHHGETPVESDLHGPKEAFSVTTQDATAAEESHVPDSQSSSRVQDEHLDDFTTEASSTGDSVADYESDGDFAHAQSQPLSESAESQPDTDAAPSLPALQSHEPAQPTLTSRIPFDPNQLPSMHALPQVLDFSMSYPPPLPPRPSAAPLPPGTRPPWYSNELPPYSSYRNVDLDQPMTSSSGPMCSGVSQLDSNYAYMMGNASSNVTCMSSRLQTPTVLSSDAMNSTTPPPGRRTKVSIGEIVEDQPPTPESLHGLKRKRDDMVEEYEPRAIDLPSSDSVPVAETHVSIEKCVPHLAEHDLNQTVATIASRPKKQPRSMLARINTTAKYLGIGAAGAAGAIAVLSALPDAFFS